MTANKSIAQYPILPNKYWLILGNTQYPNANIVLTLITNVRLTLNAAAVEVLVFGHVVVVGIVEQSLRRYAADVEARSTKRIILLHTNCLLTKSHFNI